MTIKKSQKVLLRNYLRKGFFLLHFQNNSNKQRFERDIDSSFIQLHFCIKGNAKFIFNNGTYTFDVLDIASIFCIQSQQKLPINLEIQPKTSLVSLLISIEKFHSLFSKKLDIFLF